MSASTVTYSDGTFYKKPSAALFCSVFVRKVDTSMIFLLFFSFFFLGGSASFVVVVVFFLLSIKGETIDEMSSFVAL